MFAKNIYGENINEIKQRFANAIEDGFAPTLAIVFCSITQDRAALVDFFQEKNIEVFGSTTAGEILDDEVYEHTSVIMLLNIKREHYKIIYQEGADTYNMANSLAKKAKTIFANPSMILISSGLTIDADQIIKGVKDYDEKLELFGGLAGDDLSMTASYVFSNNFESSNALLVLVLNGDKIKVQGLATSGWDEIGIEKTITKSTGNVVYAIDDEPAVDVFVKFFKFHDNVYDRSEIVAMNFAQYPLQLKNKTGNVVLRSPLMVDIENKALIFAGALPEGSKVKFSVPPGFDLIEKTAERVSVLKEKILNPDAVLMFSCKARHLALGPLTSDEAGKIRSIWDKPLIGFFTYGEIGTAQKSSCDFHNATCSMVVMEEIEKS
ncbi:MAG: FIST C-terminal domain-containing protein [Sphingobacteriales bacterium]|nr:FIST C-terminal domain-containing protein [Sphingobacteriales bacterium]MBI3720102.1 FIST C-terminal domain-containing protein [Sphingobacteriales bacterium]